MSYTCIRLREPSHHQANCTNTQFFPVHELPSGTISSFGKLSRRLIDSKSISSSSQSSRQPRMPSGKIIIIAFGLRWWCRERLLARAFGLSFVSTQNAQGVGEFTLLPTTTYLALNKHIKPQNEVIAWPPGLLAGEQKVRSMKNWFMTLGQTEKAGSNFFPLLSLFVFFFFGLFISLQFFFFFLIVLPRHGIVVVNLLQLLLL